MIAFVTTNEGKFREVSAALAEASVRIVREDRSYPEIQADRLEKVVRFAATILDDQIPGDYLIDDSGLFLDAFGGFPGVYSSYVQKRLGCAGILRLLAEGADTLDISRQLRYSERTIKGLIQDIERELGARSRAQAVARGIRRGLI